MFNFKKILRENIQQTRLLLWEGLGQLDERARYREKDIELPELWDVLKKLKVDNPNDSQYFVHLSQIEKVGINPQFSHDESPIGIYTYPIDEEFFRIFKDKVVYATDFPYVFILKFVGDPSKIYTFGQRSKLYSEMSEESYNKYLNLIKVLFNGKPEFEKISKFEKEYRSFEPIQRLWNITRGLVGDGNGKQWGFLLKKLGINGFVDSGLGAIHAAEDSQAIFFNYPDLQIEYEFTNISDSRRYEKLINNIIDLYKNGKVPSEKMFNELNDVNLKKVVEDDELYFDKFWVKLSKRKNLPEEFIVKFSGYLDWGYISLYQNLSEDFIEKFRNKINWISLSKNKEIPEETKNKFINKGKVKNGV